MLPTGRDDHICRIGLHAAKGEIGGSRLPVCVSAPERDVAHEFACGASGERMGDLHPLTDIGRNIDAQIDGSIWCGSLLADESTAADCGYEISSAQAQVVSAGDGANAHPQFISQFPLRGQFGAAGQMTFRDGLVDIVCKPLIGRVFGLRFCLQECLPNCHGDKNNIVSLYCHA